MTLVLYLYPLKLAKRLLKADTLISGKPNMSAMEERKAKGIRFRGEKITISDIMFFGESGILFTFIQS